MLPIRPLTHWRGSFPRWSPVLLLGLATMAAPPAAAAQDRPPVARASTQRPALPDWELPAWEREGTFADLPHPRDVFGFDPGEDYRLATHGQIVEYFRRLDAASDRVRVEEIGTSVLGRPLVLAYISSADNVARLDELRARTERLALGRATPEEAEALAAGGKAVVWIDGGLHATEVAGAQHAPLLAWRVAAEESPEMRRIRDDVVLLLMPVMNPDGLDLVAAWTAGSIGTAWEGSSPPVLYHFYAGHDNNRDWFMMTQPETRAVADVLYRRWFPQIVYNQHQTAPWPARIFIPPFADPVNPAIPPLVVRGVNVVGSAMGQRFDREEKPGAISRISFDMWWNGGMRTAPYFHNMVGILTETAHAAVAPRYTRPAELPSHIGTTPATAPSVFHPDPWTGGWFRLRDAVEYMITGAMGVLDVASRRREEWLLNAWRMAREAIETGDAGSPFAYVVPPGQRHPREAAALVDALRRGGLTVRQATRPFTAGGERWPAGSFVIPAAHAFRPHLVDLMEPHVYPDMRVYPGGPPQPPYDISGWTLPLQMDVHAARVDRPFDLSGMPEVTEPRVWPGRLIGQGGWGWAMSGASNAAALAVNRLLAAGATASIAPDGVLAGDREMGRGAYVVRAARREVLEPLAVELGVDFVALDGEPRDRRLPLSLPRVGLYKSWIPSMDEGWTRWVLDGYGFPVDTLHDADIRDGDLSRYHVIIVPDQRATAILHGNPTGSRPEPFTGGLGLDGVLRLRQYVEGGGRLVAFDRATRLFIDQFGLPVRDVVAGLPPEEFFVPGTLVGLELEDHALTRGMGEGAVGFFVRSRAFEPAPGGEVDVAAWYAGEDPVRSGWALGAERHLAGRAALLRVPLGAGDVVLFAFRPQFRGQPRGTFRMLFNAIHDAAAARPADPRGSQASRD